MKKTGYCLLFILLSLYLCACDGRSGETSGYQINYKSEEGFKLAELSYIPVAQSGDSLAWELLNMISQPPNSSLISCVPDSVSILGLEFENQHLKVNISKEYKKLDSMSQVLLRAGIVRTLVQMPEVADVTFEVNGKAMVDKDGNPVGTMDAAAFIDTKGEGINSYQFAALTLYFSNQTGDGIVQEMRNVHYSSSASLEKVVLDQLLSGPVNERLLPVIPEAAEVLDINIKKNICTVNFNNAFSEGSINENLKPDTTIYAIVNALCDVCDVAKVQLQIEGDSNVVYRNAVSLAEPFERNKDIIVNIEDMEEPVENSAEESETKEPKEEPSLGVDPELKGD